MDGSAVLVTDVPISTSSCAGAAITRPHHRIGCGAGAPAGTGAVGRPPGALLREGPKPGDGRPSDGAVGAYAGCGGSGWGRSAYCGWAGTRGSGRVAARASGAKSSNCAA